jgi:hypothetical protein
VLSGTASPAYGGTSFSQVGQYEQLDGTAYGELDPDDPANAIIQDIALAPRNANGMVSYSMDVSILKPVDESKGNGVLLNDVVNRAMRLLRVCSTSAGRQQVRLAMVSSSNKVTPSSGAAGRAT